MTEHERIAWLRHFFGDTNGAHDKVLLGIGDDAAVLAPMRSSQVVSVDAHVENVHFARDLMTFEEVGYRATMAALSDLAAMGAKPLGVLASIALPSGEPDTTLHDIARGQKSAATAAGTTMIGGNLSRASEVSISTTVLGTASRPILRNGARPGDLVVLGGPVGLAGAGLRIARRGGATTHAEKVAIAAFKHPLARIDLGQRAASERVSAMIDVSDGLAADASHIAKESGLELVLEESALEDPLLSELAASLGCTATELALYGGEDFALLATIGADPIPEGMRRIGRCLPSDEPKVLVAERNGTVRPVDVHGFDHFA